MSNVSMRVGGENSSPPLSCVSSFVSNTNNNNKRINTNNNSSDHPHTISVKLKTQNLNASLPAKSSNKSKSNNNSCTSSTVSTSSFSQSCKNTKILFNSFYNNMNKSIKNVNSIKINQSNCNVSSSCMPKSSSSFLSSSSLYPIHNSEYQNVTFEGEVCHTGFLLHQIVSVLQERKKQMHILEIEKILREKGINGVDIQTNYKLLCAINNHSQITYDKNNQTFSYINPYARITNADILLHTVQTQAKLTGLRVSEDLLNANSDMCTYINRLLATRQIRCIRLTNSHLRGKKKCKFAGSGNECDLYAKTKCKECFNNLNGLFIYPLSNTDIESTRYNLQDDVKQLWKNISTPPMDEILKEMNVEMPNNKWEKPVQTKRRKRQVDETGRVKTKLRRIQNSHLFTAEQLRVEVLQTAF